MKIRGTINYEGKEIAIDEKNITEIILERNKALRLSVTVLIGDKELTFRENSIYSLRIVHIEDQIKQQIQVIENQIDSVTGK